MKAPSTEYLEPIFKPEDSKGVYIAMNEFANCISCPIPDMICACYWIEWVIEFEYLCKKRKEKQVCERRPLIPVDVCFQKDIIWIIWDSIIHYGEEKELFIRKTLSSLLNLFCIKYTTSSCKKRRYLLYFAVGLLIENIQTNTDMVGDKTTIQSVISQINDVYKQIKKNEVSPKTEYLFSNLDDDCNRNTEQSIRKLGIMDSIG